MKRILGIESSCDETAAAVVTSSGDLLASVVASQIDTHGKYGGVVPELASREHLRAIVPVVRGALERARLDWPELDAVAVTAGPGLVGSLLVGLTFAKAVCLVRGLPLIGVNHVEGHIHAVLLDARQAGDEIELPAVALVATRGIQSLLLATSARDAVTFVLAPAILAIVALAACWLPAYRAAGIDPSTTLRDE